MSELMKALERVRVLEGLIRQTASMIESGTLKFDTSGDPNPDQRERLAPITKFIADIYQAIADGGAPELQPESAGEVCEACGCTLVHIAGPGVQAVLCPVCNHDASAFQDDKV
ncbi:MAG TPA: hypothetical protein VNH18_10560 [Bryobacteraceae bacterium]|nr:hypothetical protein [Bryobacteraceae bacterium]